MFVGLQHVLSTCSRDHIELAPRAGGHTLLWIAAWIPWTVSDFTIADEHAGVSRRNGKGGWNEQDGEQQEGGIAHCGMS